MNEATLQQIEARVDRTSRKELVRLIHALATEVRFLRQELRDYAQHDGGCYKKYTETELRRTGWTDEMLANRTCTCGLDAVFGDEEEGNHDPETGTPAEPRV